MSLQGDVASRQAAEGVAVEEADRVAVEPDRDLAAARLDLERVPLPDRPAGQALCRRQAVDRTRAMEGVARRPRLRSLAAVVDLDFVPEVHGRFPVLVRIAAAELRDAQEDARVVRPAGGPPVDLEDEIRE